MKNRNLLSFLTIALVAFFSACQTVESISIEITEEEAVETVEQSLAYSAGGYAKYVEGLAAVYAKTMDSCGITGDTIITTSISSGTTTYNYSSTYDYTLNCTAGIPSSLTVTLSANGTLATPRIGTTDNADANANTLTNLSAGQTEFNVNGVYARSGAMTSKIAKKGTFNYNFTATMTNITVNKTTKQITGGTATYTFAGVTQSFGSKSFNYNGTITFSGAGNATMTMAGNNHTIVIN